jgi:ATP-binding cassette subfamily F protein uup
LWQAAGKKGKVNPAAPRAAVPAVGAAASPAGKKRLSYLENREYETIEARIAEAELAVEAKAALLENPDVLKDGRRLEQAYREMEEARSAVDDLYARWAELEAKSR